MSGKARVVYYPSRSNCEFKFVEFDDDETECTYISVGLQNVCRLLEISQTFRKQTKKSLSVCDSDIIDRFVLVCKKEQIDGRICQGSLYEKTTLLSFIKENGDPSLVNKLLAVFDHDSSSFDKPKRGDAVYVADCNLQGYQFKLGFYFEDKTKEVTDIYVLVQDVYKQLDLVNYHGCNAWKQVFSDRFSDQSFEDCCDATDAEFFKTSRDLYAPIWAVLEFYSKTHLEVDTTVQRRFFEGISNLMLFYESVSDLVFETCPNCSFPHFTSNECARCAKNKVANPDNWPNQADYLNAIRTIWGPETRDYALPPVNRELVQLKPLPEGHPARKDDTCRGLFAREEWLYTFYKKKENLVGYYAGILRPVCDVPDNEYIMATDDKQNMDFDAYSCGNETRYINDFRNIAEKPNCRLGGLIHLHDTDPTVPEWVTARPIYITRDIAKGEELLLDYGEAYWEARQMDQLDQPAQPSFQPGQLVEVDWSSAFPNDEEWNTCKRQAVVQGKHDASDGYKLAIGQNGEKFIVSPKHIDIARGSLFDEPLANTDVEVCSTQDGKNDWWGAYLLGQMPESNQVQVIYKKASGPVNDIQLVPRAKVRNVAQEPKLKKRKL